MMSRKKKDKTPKRYLLITEGYDFVSKAYHLHACISNKAIAQAIADLKEQEPRCKVLLYEYKIVPMLVDTPTVKPYNRIKKLKHVVKSSSEWIKEGERTAICNLCGAVGPTVPMNGDGNRMLTAAGWFKEDSNVASQDIWGFFGGANPVFTLRCPSCDEQAANKDTREDWFT